MLYNGTYDSPMEFNLFKLLLIAKDIPKSSDGPSGLSVMRHVSNTFNNASKKQNICSFEYVPTVQTDKAPNPKLSNIGKNHEKSFCLL